MKKTLHAPLIHLTGNELISFSSKYSYVERELMLSQFQRTGRSIWHLNKMEILATITKITGQIYYKHWSVLNFPAASWWANVNGTMAEHQQKFHVLLYTCKLIILAAKAITAHGYTLFYSAILSTIMSVNFSLKRRFQRKCVFNLTFLRV